MRRLFAPILGVVAALSVTIAMAASSWPMAGSNAQDTSFNASEHGISARNVSALHQVWRRNFGVFVTAIAAGNRIYGIDVANSHFNVVVLDAATGALLRTFTPASLHLTARPYDEPQSLAYANGRLVVGAARDVVEISPKSGHLFWKVTGGADELTVAGRTIYTGKSCQNTCGAVASYAIDLYKGKVLWTHKGNFGQRPVLVAGHLYQDWGVAGGSTHIYDPSDGSLLATMSLSGGWTGSSKDAYTLVGLPAPGHVRNWLGEIGPDGKAVWKVDLGKTVGDTPVLAYGSLFASSFRFHPGIVAVNAQNGHIRWAANVGRSLPMAAAGHLIFAMQQSNGVVTVLNASSGKTLRTLRPAGYAFNGTATLMVAGGTLYVIDGKGVFAYRP